MRLIIDYTSVLPTFVAPSTFYYIDLTGWSGTLYLYSADLWPAYVDTNGVQRYRCMGIYEGIVYKLVWPNEL